MKHHELLLRLAQTLKQEVGPAVGPEYPRTQAFMASVVLEKLARELAAETRHAEASAAAHAALLAALDVTGLPPAVLDAHAAFDQARDDASLARLIEALYAARGSIGKQRFQALLDRIRQDLRNAIDRRMEYSA